MDLLVVFYCLIGVVILVVWIYQFVQLMLLCDSDFPGKYDKTLWAAAFILAFVVAPFAFLWWKAAYRSMLAQGQATDDERS